MSEITYKQSYIVKFLLCKCLQGRVDQIWQVVDGYFLSLPENGDILQYTITPQEWVAMQDVEMVLSVSHMMSL